MITRSWKWNLQRKAIDIAGYLRPFRSTGKLRRVLFITEKDPISLAQIFPFFVHAAQLRSLFGIEIRELPMRRFAKENHDYTGPVDAVLFQSWFDLTPDQLAALASRIKCTWPMARLAYLDWFAPTDLRFAEVLDEHIAAYVKKQILADFSRYDCATIGDTNLTDYYAPRFKIDLPHTKHRIPRGFEKKIVLGSNFESSPEIFFNLNSSWICQTRDIDVHARIATAGTPWYSQMRSEALEAVQRLMQKHNVVSSGRVAKRQYTNELKRSKVCFSPFGYGEVCWRDYEAMSLGALLLKPDMSHLKIKNNPFVAFETYIPLRWDLSDLPEKVEHYVHHREAAATIARNAFELLRLRQTKSQFVQDTTSLWKLLEIAP